MYSDGKISVFEVDGVKNVTYSENLCYLSKLFLDHKTLEWDTTPFAFFILTEIDQYGHHIVGYFSREKDSLQGWNLSCILVLPFYQRRGFGKFLITFSYELSKLERRIGSPERPLSDLGRKSYMAWWIQQIIKYMLQNEGKDYSILDIQKSTYIKSSDILFTLGEFKMIKFSSGKYFLLNNKAFLEKTFKLGGREGYPVDPEKILWVGYK